MNYRLLCATLIFLVTPAMHGMSKCVTQMCENVQKSIGYLVDAEKDMNKYPPRLHTWENSLDILTDTSFDKFIELVTNNPTSFHSDQSRELAKAIIKSDTSIMERLEKIKQAGLPLESESSPLLSYLNFSDNKTSASIAASFICSFNINTHVKMPNDIPLLHYMVCNFPGKGPIRKLIEKGHDPNCVDAAGRTPLAALLSKEIEPSMNIYFAFNVPALIEHNAIITPDIMQRVNEIEAYCTLDKFTNYYFASAANLIKETAARQASANQH